MESMDPRFKMKIMNKREDSDNYYSNAEYLDGYEDAITELPESSISSMITRAFVSQTLKKKEFPNIDDILSEALKHIPTLDELYLGFSEKDITILKSAKLSIAIPGTSLYNVILLLSKTVIPEYTLCRMLTSIVARELDITLLPNKPIYLNEAVKLTSTIHGLIKYATKGNNGMIKSDEISLYNRILDEMETRLKWQENHGDK